MWANLPTLPLSRKGEYYLTDTVALAVAQGRTVNDLCAAEESELLGINTRVHLAEAERVLRARINRHWMEAGVTLMDPATTYIDADVTIGQDTTVLPNTYLLGRADRRGLPDRTGHNHRGLLHRGRLYGDVVGIGAGGHGR